MEFSVKHELRLFVTYFLIALVSEVAGFFGWMTEMTKGGNFFQLKTAFWNHEVSRIWFWMPVFLGLSALRLVILFLAQKARQAKGRGET